MLCERLGVSSEEDEEFAKWRGKREGEREKLRQENDALQTEVQCIIIYRIPKNFRDKILLRNIHLRAIACA